MYFFKNDWSNPIDSSSTIILSCGWFFIWEFKMNSDNLSSWTTSNVSLRTHKISNLDKIGSDNSTLSLNDILSSYLPFYGFAAAITEHLAFNVATIEAFDIEILYYSIASWIDVLSYSLILSNSSIKQIPVSANTKAPASKHHSPLIGSLFTLAVKPTAEAPLPEV